MLQKNYKWLAYLVLAFLLASPLLVAADPAPPVDLPEGFAELAPPLGGESMPLPLEADLSAAPALIQDVVALRESLTAEQLAAITSTLDKYLPQFDTIMAQMPAPELAEPRGKKAAPADLKAAEKALGLVAQVDALQAEVNAEFEAILSPDQYAAFLRGLSPAREVADAWRTAAHPLAAELTCTYCYYAGQYASLGDYYAYLMYLYAYYCYYYCGTTYAYYAYYYAYYAYVSYGWDGLQRIAVGYFDCLVIGSDSNGGISSSINYLYNAYYYSYYASVYAYNAYYNDGCTSYCYYAYYYGYNYARYYWYYAYYYAYYCYNT